MGEVMIAVSAFDEDDIVPGGKTSQWYQGYIKGMADCMRMERESRRASPVNGPNYTVGYTNQVGEVVHTDVEDWHGKSEQFR